MVANRRLVSTAGATRVMRRSPVAVAQGCPLRRDASDSPLTRLGAQAAWSPLARTDPVLTGR